MPVMVCMDGFILTHAYEQVDMPTQAQVDAFLPPYEPRQVLDPAEPVSIGAMVGPEAFMEVRYLAHAKQLSALQRIPQIGAEFQRCFGRNTGGLLRGYHLAGAETVVVALGSVLGTLRETVDELRREGQRIGVLGITSFRPFPLAAVREALQGAQRVIVLEKSFSVGLGGVVSTDVRLALSGLSLRGCTVVAGLGGRAITQASLRRMLLEAVADRLPPLSFLDLDMRIVERQLAREAQARRSGPIAENLLRDLGTVASKVS
jgi:pyruvate ferredoxin oxidoreductase alpha subunit